MYREYKLMCKFREQTVLSKHMFRKVFNTQFNLSFKKPKIDTCKVCEILNMKTSSNDSSYEEQQIDHQSKIAHDDDVERVKLEFHNDIEKARASNGQIQCLTFDLENTLETPSLSVNEAYYKRKLWTYNLCIYDEAVRKGYMYIWSEAIASRGTEEISSR